MSVWAERDVHILRKRFTAGDSAAQIARRLGPAHRLGLKHPHPRGRDASYKSAAMRKLWKNPVYREYVIAMQAAAFARRTA